MVGSAWKHRAWSASEETGLEQALFPQAELNVAVNVSIVRKEFPREYRNGVTIVRGLHIARMV